MVLFRKSRNFRTRSARKLVVFYVFFVHWDVDKFLLKGGRIVGAFFLLHILPLAITSEKMCAK